MTHGYSTSSFPRLRGVLVLALPLLLLSGCEATTRYKAYSVIFNRVPAFPQPEEVCRDYQNDKQARTEAAKAGGEAPKGQVIHAPYGEKRCPDCHSAEKDVGGGLVAPPNKLCFKCHPTILEYRYAHGPAAEGDCLACHQPHSSTYRALLLVEREKLCEGCHTERRLAAGMHIRVQQKGVVCLGCHTPHSASNKYLLR